MPNSDNIDRRAAAKPRKLKRVVRPNPDQQPVKPRGPSLGELTAGIAARDKAAKAPATGAKAVARISQAQSRARTPAQTTKLIRTSQQRERDARQPLKVKRSLLEKLLNPMDLSDTKNTRAGDRAALAMARVDAAGSIPTAATGVVGLAAKNTGMSIAEHPGAQLKRLPGDAAKSVIAIPAGLYGVARHPKAGVEAIGKDYERRYGPLLHGEQGAKEFRDRQAKEGVLPELLDASTVATAGGAAVGRGLQVAAKEGRLGLKLKRVASEPRPHVQVSAGKTKAQHLSPNLLTNVVVKRVDKTRARAVTKRVARAGDAKDLVDVEAQRGGHVRPVLRARRAQIDRTDAAKLDSASRATMKGELHRTSGQLERMIVKTLNRDEQRGLTYAVKFGIRDPSQARRVLTAHATQIRRERTAAGADGTPVSLTPKTDQLPEIERLIAHADRVFTPNVARVADEYAATSRTAGLADPGLRGEESQRVRAIKPLAELHGVRIKPAETKVEAARRVRVVAAKESRAKTTLVRAERKAAREQGRAEIRQVPIDREAMRAHPAYVATAKHYAKAVKERDAAKRVFGNEARIPGNDVALTAAVHRVAAAQQKVEAAHAAFRAVKTDLTKAADEAVTKAAATRGAARPPVAALGRQAPVRLRALQDAEGAAAQARVALEKAKAERKDAATRRPAETNAAFLERAQRAIPEDLAEPAYFKSEKRSDSPFGAFTRGAGKTAKPKDKHYEGALSRTGRESSDPAVLVRSVAGNISRRFNWQFVRDNVHDGSPEWGRNKSRSYLLDEAERRGIDPASFVLVRHQIVDRDAKLADAAGSDVSEAGDAATQTAIHDALTEASLPGEKAAALKRSGGLDLAQNSGWTLMAKARHKELMSNATPSGAASRSYDVAKGKVSRVLLGTPGWLQFQVASNGLLTGLAGTGPIDAAKAQLWWRKLPAEQQAALEPMLGMAPWFDEQTRLGATANNKIVNAWRGFKTTRLYNHALNPTTVPRRSLDVLFKADNAQNNAFRKAVLYSQVKRDAYAKMGASTRNIIRTQADVAPSLEALSRRLAHMADLGPTDLIADVLKDKTQMEKHAAYVNDFLGDYMSYSARERRYIGKNVMFYGFIRYSLRFTFYTMPVRHPIVSSIMAQLGRMQTDELERIFGTSPPPWELANFYSADGKQRVNIGRLVPFFNAMGYFNFETGAPTAGAAAYGSLPPYLQIGVNALAARDLARDQARTTSGGEYNYGQEDLTLGERLRVAFAEAANLPPALRLLKKTGVPGVRKPDRGAQTSESSLFTPDPRIYKRPDKIAANEQRKAEDAAGHPVRDFVIPIGGGDGRPIIRASQQRAVANHEPVKLRKIKRVPKTVGDPAVQQAIDEAMLQARSPETQRLIREALAQARHAG